MQLHAARGADGNSGAATRANTCVQERTRDERGREPLTAPPPRSGRSLFIVRFTRITVEPVKTGGPPCIRGMRMAVVTVVAMVEDGMTTEQILADHPSLEVEDIAEAVTYAEATGPGKPRVERVLTRDEFNEMLRDAAPPTLDDVSITTDGRRLDTKEAVIAFLAELDAWRASTATPDADE